MKKIIYAATAVLLGFSPAFSQVSGNVNYQNPVYFQENNIDIGIGPKDVVITVKGLANVKADSYVAIFNVTQVGENIEEVNAKAENRIAEVRKQFEGKPEMEIYTDMISFVPVYEYELEKKLFSKKTYNEIPKGFELKMNLHVRYTDPAVLGKVVAACAASEVYDLVRVDYFSSQLEQIKKDLAARSKVLLKEKLKFQQEMLGSDFAAYPKHMNDGYRTVYPLEMYKSYQAYSNSSLNLKKNVSSSQSEKSTTMYYQPVVNKEFDFVISQEIVEPVIQVMYEIVFVVTLPEDKSSQKPDREYMIITPDGDIRTLPVQVQ